MTLLTILQFIAIPGSILCWPKLLPLDKILFGLLRFCQNSKDHCWANPETWAAWLGCDARTIRASVKRLIKAGCLTLEQVDSRTVYAVLTVKDSFYLRVPVSLLTKTDLSFSERLGLALIWFNTCGSEDRHGWAGHDTMAAWLGCSRRSIIRIMDALKAKGLIEVRRRGPRSNQYSLTPAGEAAIVAHHPAKRCDNFARPYKTSENESSKELKRTAVQEVPAAGLSGFRRIESAGTPEDRAFERLIEHGVNRTVAESLVYVQHHPAASVEQAIDNALVRQAVHRQKGDDRFRAFKLAAYVVGSLNQARREASLIKPSRLFVHAKARHDQAELHRREAWRPLPESEFEQRRRRCLEQLRAAAG